MYVWASSLHLGVRRRFDRRLRCWFGGKTDASRRAPSSGEPPRPSHGTSRGSGHTRRQLTLVLLLSLPPILPSKPAFSTPSRPVFVKKYSRSWSRRAGKHCRDLQASRAQIARQRLPREGRVSGAHWRRSLRRSSSCLTVKRNGSCQSPQVALSASTYSRGS